MDWMEDIAKLLQTYGGWGVCVFLAWMWNRDLKSWETEKKAYSNLLEKRHEEIVEVITEDAKAMTALDDTNRRVETVLLKVEAKL